MTPLALPREAILLSLLKWLQLGDAMDEVVGETSVDLDGRFKIIRTQESNLGNFVCDCWRLACGADLTILNR